MDEMRRVAAPAVYRGASSMFAVAFGQLIGISTVMLDETRRWVKNSCRGRELATN